jgi:hypothetical protein
VVVSPDVMGTGHHAAVAADVGPGNTVAPDAIATFFKNVTIGGGPAPVRAYIEELLPGVRAGSSRAGSSTGSSGSTKCLTATGP